ncbi:MAG: hypothetical protein Q8N63_00065 [Nanoarchaeota archaeon]|nr:hypothetical protein [Nanoarchaeota archaeon]
MNKRGLSFWDILAWVALGLILLWLILKTFGIINTPLWLEYSPIYAAVYIAGWQIHKLAIVSEDVKELKRFKWQTINKINNIKTNCKINHK